MLTLKKKIDGYNKMMAELDSEIRRSTDHADELSKKLQNALDDGEAKLALALQKELTEAETQRDVANESRARLASKAPITNSNLRNRFSVRRAEMEKSLLPISKRLGKQLDALHDLYREYSVLCSSMEVEAAEWRKLAAYTEDKKLGSLVALHNLVPPTINEFEHVSYLLNQANRVQ